jgi:cytochrome P450
VDPDEYIRDMLFTIFLQLFFGVQRNAPLSDDMRSLYAIIDLRNRACGSDRKKKRATEELIVLLRQRAASYGDVRAERAARPRCFLRVVMEADPDAARDDTLLGNLVYMVALGTNDVMGLIRWILKMLVDHPAWSQRLREQGETLGYRADGPISMAERIVKETLRLEQSEFLLRRSTRDIWFEGYRIPKNWLIRICIREGHRDSNVFAGPNAFDPDRFRDRKYSKIEYAPFGLYRHNCLGAHLTHAICRAFVIELARGFELQTGEKWSTERGIFHWQPLHGHRIDLYRRTAAAADQDVSDLRPG